MNPMQARFHDLGRLKAEAEAKIKPVAERYDALRRQQNEIDAALKPIIAELKALRAPLFDIDNERAALSRALNGQTGKP